MTAAPRYLTPPSSTATSSHALVAHAQSLQAAGRTRDAEAALRDAITIAPDSLHAHQALTLFLVGAGRDIEAFAACGIMLAAAGQADEQTLRLAADVLLFLHIRHEALITRRLEPARLDLRPVGVADVAPLVLAPEYLTWARTLALLAVQRNPTDATALCALAECDLRAGHVSAARRAAERAAACEPTSGALVARALATFADEDGTAAFDLLREPQLTELAPELGTGQQLTAHIIDPVEAGVATSDVERLAWSIPYVVHHEGIAHERALTIRTGPPALRSIAGGRVVGGLFFPLDRADRAFVHGVVDEPDVEFGTPRCHDVPSVLARGRNCVLWTGTDRRLLLHSPAGERLRGGRAFLLATNMSSSYHHWIADALGRLSAMPEVLRDPDVRFVVPAPLLPFQVETLGWLGISLERVVQVTPDEIIEFDEVLAVAHRKDGGCTDVGVWRWLQAHLTIPSMQTTPPPRRRLFLRDAGGAGRHLLNATDAEAICVAHGFESIDTRTWTVAERRDRFSEAAIVVAPIGSAVTDLLFAPAGARTVLFGLRSFVVPCYGAMAHALGHSVRYVLGAEEPSRVVYPHWDYRIDTRALAHALRAVLD